MASVTPREVLVMDAKGTDALAQRLSEVYYPLEMKSFQILLGLQHRIFDPQLAYYSGHHRKLAMAYIA